MAKASPHERGDAKKKTPKEDDGRQTAAAQPVDVGVVDANATGTGRGDGCNSGS